ncbi:hypothetical protein ABHF33_13335 [Chitinibacter sp. FCG-7]|uniref:Uncharacterized protein n=1 Tax=Chitinibacter mangrovi TaxID=3153927 RepID=A0AAU7F809_9NEIS
MAYRFRVSHSAFVQLRQLEVPMALLEYLAQPALCGAAAMLSQRMIAKMPRHLRVVAQNFIGLYVVADGQGEVKEVKCMKHRLAIAEQAEQYGFSADCTRIEFGKTTGWRTSIGA